MAANPWPAVQAALEELEQVCLQEQEALIRLDSRAVADLVPRKSDLVMAVGSWMRRLGGGLGHTAPPGIARLARHCHLLNASNQRMLALAVSTLGSFLKEAGGPAPGYAAAPRRASHLIDSRV